MKIIDIFDAVMDGTYEEFRQFYSGDANLVRKASGLSLLGFAVVNDTNPEDKIKIIRFLISEGANINYVDTKDRRNVLHIFYFNVLRPEPEYMLYLTKLFVENGVDINAKDKYNAIPMKYALTITKLPTEAIKSVYRYLLIKGSDINSKDIFGKSCIDYMKECSWRNDVIRIIKEYADEK